MVRRAFAVLLLLLLTCGQQKHYQTIAFKIIPGSSFSKASLYRECLKSNRQLQVRSKEHLEEANGKYASTEATLTRTITQNNNESNQSSYECILQLKELNEKVKQKGYKGNPREEIETIISSSGKEHLTLKHGMIMINIYKAYGDLKEAFQVIDMLMASGITPDTYIYNNLINGCAKNADHILAERVLQHMKLQDVPKDHWTYTAAIKSFAKAGYWDRAVQFLDDMDRENIPPDTVTYSAAISACASKGRVKEAVELLGEMKEKKVPTDTIIYNSVIDAAAQAGKADIAISIIDHMYKVNISRDIYTFTSVIAACDKGDDFHGASMVLDRMINDGIILKSPPFNTIIHTAFRVGKTDDAMRLYHRMLAMHVQPSIVTYTILITCSSRNGANQQIVQLYNDMLKYQVPFNYNICGCLLACFSAEGMADEATRILEYMKSEQMFIGMNEMNYVIGACAKGNQYDKALKYLNEMRAKNISTTEKTFNTLIASCKQKGKWQEALRLIEEMQNIDNLQPDTFIFSTAISVCVESKQWPLALELLERMEEQNVPRNIITLNSVIEALESSNEIHRAAIVYHMGFKDGIYDHWSKFNSNFHFSSGQPQSVPQMDLHKMPYSVAKNAVMHALGEMSAGRQEITDMIIITGRGRHSNKGKSGVLRRGIESYCKSIALKIGEDDPSGINPGRIYVKKEEIFEWLQAQQSQTLEGSAHKNLFLQVSKVKDNSDQVRVRGVCPFNAAATYNATDINEDSPLLVSNDTIRGENTGENLEDTTLSLPLEVSNGKCPFHNSSADSEVSGLVENEVSTSKPSVSKCPAHQVGLKNSGHERMEENLVYKPKDNVETGTTMDSLMTTYSESKCPAHQAESINEDRRISQENYQVQRSKVENNAKNDVNVNVNKCKDDNDTTEEIAGVNTGDITTESDIGIDHRGCPAHRG